MNESFIHHVVRVAVILGILIGLSAFALLLYASDFWSSPPKNLSDSDVAPVADDSPALEPQRDFGQRAMVWMFGEPDPNLPAATPAGAAPETAVTPAAAPAPAQPETPKETPAQTPVETPAETLAPATP